MATTNVSVVFFLSLGDKLTKPMVYPEIRNSIPHEKVQPAKVGSHIVQAAPSQEKTQVTQSDQLRVPRLVQWAAGIEMVDTTEITVLLALTSTLGLTLMVVVAGDIGNEVQGPTEQLLEEEGSGGQNWSLLHQFAQLVCSLADTRSIVLPGLGNENHVASQVSSSLVVLSVRDLPREVRDQQERMAEPTDGVIQDFVRRKCLMTALVSQNPHTSSNETLNDGIERPQDGTHWHGRHSLRCHIIVEEVEDGGQHGQVPGHIVQALNRGPMVAVSWDRIPNLFNREIGDLELFPVGVKHLAVPNLPIRSQRGQRSRRRRLAWAVEWRWRDGTRHGGVSSRVAVQRNALGDCRRRHFQ